MLEAKIKDYIQSGYDSRKIAKWLLNLHISKHVPISINDLTDSAVMMDEMDAIEEAIIEKDYSGAINIAVDGAYNILEDQGFEI